MLDYQGLTVFIRRSGRIDLYKGGVRVNSQTLLNTVRPAVQGDNATEKDVRQKQSAFEAPPKDALLNNATVCPGDSCAGRCGTSAYKLYDLQAGCNCDKLCLVVRDCRWDFNAVCPEISNLNPWDNKSEPT